MPWGAMLLFLLTAVFTPGPNNLTCLAQATTAGFRKTVPFILGIALGFFLIFIASGALNLTLARALPVLKKVLPPLGCAYLIWLAWKIWKGGASQSNGEASGFVSGALLQLVNVKVLMNSLTVMSSFVTPYDSRFSTVLAVTALSTALSVTSCSAWAAFGSVFSRFLARYDRVFRGVMSLLVLWCAYTALSSLWSVR